MKGKFYLLALAMTMMPFACVVETVADDNDDDEGDGLVCSEKSCSKWGDCYPPPPTCMYQSVCQPATDGDCLASEKCADPEWQSCCLWHNSTDGCTHCGPC